MVMDGMVMFILLVNSNGEEVATGGMESGSEATYLIVLLLVVI